ncbi:MAG: DUF2231 domain-containing protein [Porticoccus sp.]|nr:DUF2231 domain-containing protein [Porticoccus sp.]
MRHPLHSALVHFPVACWTVAVASDFLSLHFGEPAWRWSVGLHVIGCITALLAMLAGLLELVRVPAGPAMRDAYLHMGAMVLALTLFSIRLMLGFEHTKPLAPDTLSLVLDAVGFTFLIVGGWFGGRLVYGHGVGRH